MNDGLPDDAQASGVVHSGEVAIVPVVEEAVEIGTREVETGRVVIRKTVSEADQVVDALLRRTDVAVDRIAVGQVVQEAPVARQEGDTWIVPILEEVLVVEKQLVLKEELHIRTTTTEEPVQRTVRLRAEQVEIEQTGGEAVHPATGRDGT